MIYDIQRFKIMVILGAIVSILAVLGLLGCERPQDPVDPTQPPPTTEELNQHKCRVSGGYVEHRDNPKQCRDVHTNEVIKL